MTDLWNKWDAELADTIQADLMRRAGPDALNHKRRISRIALEKATVVVSGGAAPAPGRSPTVASSSALAGEGRDSCLADLPSPASAAVSEPSVPVHVVPADGLTALSQSGASGMAVLTWLRGAWA